jgi:hypothetical protein
MVLKQFYHCSIGLWTWHFPLAIWLLVMALATWLQACNLSKNSSAHSSLFYSILFDWMLPLWNYMMLLSMQSRQMQLACELYLQNNIVDLECWWSVPCYWDYCPAIIILSLVYLVLTMRGNVFQQRLCIKSYNPTKLNLWNISWQWRPLITHNLSNSTACVWYRSENQFLITSPLITHTLSNSCLWICCGQNQFLIT